MIDQIKKLIAEALRDRRTKNITGPQLKALFLNLPDPAWDTLASYFASNDAQRLGEWQINGLKQRMLNQANTEVDAILADGSLSLTELTNLMNS